ncbi:MAG: hypothetical protein ACXIVE_11580 [Salinarimonas sp.]
MQPGFPAARLHGSLVIFFARLHRVFILTNPTEEEIDDRNAASHAAPATASLRFSRYATSPYDKERQPIRQALDNHVAKN